MQQLRLGFDGPPRIHVGFPDRSSEACGPVSDSVRSSSNAFEMDLRLFVMTVLPHHPHLVVDWWRLG